MTWVSSRSGNKLRGQLSDLAEPGVSDCYARHVLPVSGDRNQALTAQVGWSLFSQRRRETDPPGGQRRSKRLPALRGRVEVVENALGRICLRERSRLSGPFGNRAHHYRALWAPSDNAGASPKR